MKTSRSVVLTLVMLCTRCSPPSIQQQQHPVPQDANAAIDSLPSGAYTISPVAVPSKCVDVRGADMDNGTPVQLWDCNDTAAQSWSYIGGTLRALGSKCLDVTGGSIADGTKVQIWDCTPGNPNQQWTIAGSTAQWTGHDLCLDLTGGDQSDGNPIQIWTCVPGNTNQQWSFHNGPRSVSAYVTSADLSQALTPQSVTLGSAAGVGIVIDASTTFQAMLGFGASITDSSSYLMWNKLVPGALQDLLTRLFHPTQGIGLSLLRQPMGASDFSSVGDFSYDDDPPGGFDGSLSHFHIDQDLKATVPVLQQALRINPGLFLMGVPWSPPAWMKTNGSMDGSGATGGNAWLAGNSYGPLAQYFVDYVRAYAGQGLPIAAVAPQNEPLYDTGNYPGMGLNDVSETAFIAGNLGPAFAAAGIGTEIWGYDHNWDQEGYPETIMQNATAAGSTEGVAWHCYAGDASAMTTFHDNHPDKSVYMTECSGGDWQADPLGATVDLLIGSANNWARAVSLWNMALDQDHGPQNRGCADCRGVVTIDNQSGQVTYNADYYALGHFSKFVRRGALRISAASADGGLNTTAFRNPDGSVVVVVHNTTSDTKSFHVAQAGITYSFSLNGGDAATFVTSP